MLTTKSLVTNQTFRRFAFPGVLSAALLGGLLFLYQGNVHASAVSASALDDNSVSSLVAMDRDMEALAARVTPAVVNVAVTSRGMGRRKRKPMSRATSIPMTCLLSSANFSV